MHPSILRRALVLFPEVDFVNAYGLTETSSTVAILGPDDHRLALYSDEPLFTARLGVGRPAGAGHRVPHRRRVGRRRSDPTSPARSSSRATRSSGKYVGTDSKVDADGWLHTGDRGWLDIEGYVFCEGRADDTIIRGGENIGPAEVEDALLQHDAISVAAVVGLPDEQYGEKIAAMISLRAGVDEVDLDHVRDWVRERIGSLKTPEIIEVVDEVPADRHRQAPPPRGQAPPRRARLRAPTRHRSIVPTVGLRVDRRRSRRRAARGGP